MSYKKELSDDELEEITGGTGESCPTRNVIAEYQETVGGMVLTEDLGRYPTADAEANGETMAKEWCSLNNKIYAGWHIADLWSNNYDAKTLLTSLPTKTVSME